MRRSTKAQDVIEERLLTAYNRIRSSVRNGLAVVSVDRDALEVVKTLFLHKGN